MIGAVIPKIMGFTIIIIIGFDLIVAKVGNVAIRMKNSVLYSCGCMVENKDTV